MTELPKRVHPRLRGYDYSRSGGYFLTLCTQGRAPILSEIVGRGIPDAPLVRLSETGRCVQDAMDYLAGHDAQIQIAASVIMPNHVHILLASAGRKRRVRMPRPTGCVPSLSPLSSATNRVCGRPLWQGSYHDHIIRDENDLLNHWSYIEHNPARWAEDEYHV
ncbi:MAG: transposase [Flavonifractor plautii]